MKQLFTTIAGFFTAFTIFAGGHTLTIASTNGLCNGDCTGSANVKVSGGTGPFIYSWTPGNLTGATINNLCAGIYSCVVTDSSDMSTASASITIIDPPKFSISFNVANTGCLSQPTTAITANINTSDTGTFQFYWTISRNGPAINVNKKGTYEVWVTSPSGCVVKDSVTIPDPIPVKVSFTSTPATCNQSDGSLSVNISGGVGPYTYKWSNGATSQTISNISAGYYDIIISDSNWFCTNSFKVALGTVSTININTTILKNLNCYGDFDGSILATASGGMSPYTYSWSNGSGAQTVGNIWASTYSVMVTDANSCVGIKSVTLTQPPSIVLNTITTSSTCGFSDGTASVIAFGGTGTLAYNWSNGGTGITIVGVSAAIYTITVSDSKNCTQTSLAYVGAKFIPPPVIDVIKNVTCYGGNDGVAVIVSPGTITPPFTYTWSNGATGQTAFNLYAGNYGVTVTDKNNCSAQEYYTRISEPGQFYVAPTTKDPENCDVVKTSISTFVSGGTGNYTYSWSTGDTIKSIKNVGCSVYSVTVTDASGCIISTSVDVNMVIGTQYCVGVPVYDTIDTGSMIMFYEIDIDGNLITKLPTGVKLYLKIISSQRPKGCLNIKNIGVVDVGDSILLTSSNNRFEFSSSCGTGDATYGIFAIGLPIMVGDSFYCKSQWGGWVAYPIPYSTTRLFTNGWLIRGYQASDFWPSCVVKACANVSVNELNQKEYSIYPNPSSGSITISPSSLIYGLEINNLIGQTIYSTHNLPTNKMIMDVSTLPRGIYIIQLMDKSNSSIFRQRLVVQ